MTRFCPVTSEKVSASEVVHILTFTATLARSTVRPVTQLMDTLMILVTL